MDELMERRQRRELDAYDFGQHFRGVTYWDRPKCPVLRFRPRRQCSVVWPEFRPPRSTDVPDGAA